MGKPLPVRKTQCATCPFRHGSPYEHLRSDLTMSALSEASRICHSTGSNGINRRTGKPPALCRGARDVQLHYFAAMRLINAPTDEAWNKCAAEIGIQPNQCKT